MEGRLRRARPLLAAGIVLIVGGAISLLAHSGSAGTTSAITTSVSKPPPSPAELAAEASHVVARTDQRRPQLQLFRHDAPDELQTVVACLTASGFGTPSSHPDDDYAGIPYASAELETDAGSYEIGIFPTQHKAFVYAFQQTSYAGAGSVAVHGSYDGQVALYSEALGDHGVAQRGKEGPAYYTERTAVAACAFSIPAASGEPEDVY